MALKYLVLFICTLQYVASTGENKFCEKPTFFCDDEDPQIAYLSDFNNRTVQCPDGQKCNDEFKSCKACVEYPEKCGGKFSCGDDLSEFISAAGTFPCEKNKICNKDFKAPCKPCVEKVCKEPAIWKCHSSDVVIFHNMYFQCAKGFYCNKNNEVPCKACIDQNGNEGSLSAYKM